MRDAAHKSLAQILEPCAPEDFLANSWGKNFRHVRGAAGKFAHLLPWERLNEILRRHRLDFPRLRLMQDGKRVPANTYLSHTTSASYKTSIPHLKPAGFIENLRAGATLVLDAVDELYGPLEELASGLELFFREHVQINCYAGWHTSRGFDLHWDDHDVFILQVAGRKRWRVYGMTRKFPITRDASDEKPASEPIWEEVLEDGDLLYLPRGFWHVAFPMDEPTLHLTAGIHNRTGIDLLRWMIERMRERESFRQDLPRFESQAEQRAHLSRLREELMEEFNDGLLETYFADYDTAARARSAIGLPWSAERDALPQGNEARVRLLAPRPLDLSIKDGVIEFSSQKKRWRFAADAALILQPLEERRVLSVKELCEAARGRLDEKTVRAFLRELILQGLVAIVTDETL